MTSNLVLRSCAGIAALAALAFLVFQIGLWTLIAVDLGGLFNSDPTGTQRALVAIAGVVMAAVGFVLMFRISLWLGRLWGLRRG